MDDLLSEFLTETTESLEKLDNEIVRLESNPNDKELLSNIFRLVHTIKGTCGFLGLPRLESVAHAGENVLGKFRDGALEVTPAGVNAVLQCFDRIKSILGDLAATGQEPSGNDRELIDQLNAIAEGKASVAAAPPPPPPPAQQKEGGATDSDDLQAIFDATPGPADVVNAGATTPSAPPPAPASPAKPEKPAETAEGKAVAAPVAETSIRVNVDVLEDLMTLVSELVLTRNQLMQILRQQKESEFVLPLQRLSQITSDLQEGVMKTRMQPIGNAWSKLPRIIRDLSHELGKKIDLQMIGQETELDRQVLEMIRDPLTHMVRNSADHGIEMPAVRAAAGKPETGQVILRAYHEGGHIIIEISDDGKGLNLGRIRQKAIENGVASADELEKMPDMQIMQLIFAPGFSTAEKVTSVSGRGVGMDVVKTNITKIGGTIELWSQEGKGSRFTIKIPLTLAIVSALIVESCAEKFAIPQLSVIELVRASENSDHRIEMIKGAPVLRLRNRLLPLVSLEELLKLEHEKTGDEDIITKARERYIVVTKVGSYSYGIIVDEVFDTEEIVVKPVAPILKHLSLFSGNTILGDGTVIMILDPNGIANATGERKGAEEDKTAEDAARLKQQADTISLLTFNAGSGGPKAVPLSLVARLEDVNVETIEYSAGRPMIQYREHLMPLVLFSSEVSIPAKGKVPLIVFTEKDQSMGLIIDQIVDIVKDRLHTDLQSDQPNLLGSAVIAGKATDIIDVNYYLDKAFGNWYGAGQIQERAVDAQPRLLLVDDSMFFRNLIMPMLSTRGFAVTAVESGQQAMALCEKGETYDVIISDIEMPDMTGLELVEKIRTSSWKSLPVVALSSLSTPEDIARAKAAGFDHYIKKSDREQVLSTLESILAEETGSGVAEKGEVA